MTRRRVQESDYAGWGYLLVDVGVLGHVEGRDGDITPWDPVSEDNVGLGSALDGGGGSRGDCDGCGSQSEEGESHGKSGVGVVEI